MRKVYYIHSKQLVPEKEAKELELIRNSFPEHEIINSSDYEQEWANLKGSEIMKRCFEFVAAADIIVFSSIKVYSGDITNTETHFVGKGVFELVKMAEDILKEIHFILNLTLTKDYELSEYTTNDWVFQYGIVEIRPKNLFWTEGS
ncbi:MAG: hypothetical protein ACTSYA_01690 [Candidatus Kariarchaeaceae archaeon]